MEYSIDNKISESGKSSITVNVLVAALDSSAVVSWYGIAVCKDTCPISREGKWYSYLVYFGENESCSNSRTITGSVDWNGCTIGYEIKQLQKDCGSGCGETITSCTFDDSSIRIIPNVVYKNTESVVLTYNTQYVVRDRCTILDKYTEQTSIEVYIRDKVENLKCSDNGKKINVSADAEICDSAITISENCYFNAGDNCCDDTEVTTTYVVNYITYNSYEANGTAYYFDNNKNIIDFNNIYSQSNNQYYNTRVFYTIVYDKYITENCKTSVEYGLRNNNIWDISSQEIATFPCEEITITSGITFHEQSLDLEAKRSDDYNRISRECSPTCNCDSLALNPNRNILATGGNDVLFGMFRYNSDCIDISEIGVSCIVTTDELPYENGAYVLDRETWVEKEGRFKFYVINDIRFNADTTITGTLSTNTSNEPREFVIKVVYNNGECEKTMVVRQLGKQ